MQQLGSVAEGYLAPAVDAVSADSVLGAQGDAGFAGAGLGAGGEGSRWGAPGEGAVGTEVL